MVHYSSFVTLGVTLHHQGPSYHWFCWCHRATDEGKKKTDPRRALLIPECILLAASIRRRQCDEFRNNDPLQPVIKQLGFTCSAPSPQAELLWSTYLLTYVAHTLTRWLLNHFQIHASDVMVWKMRRTPECANRIWPTKSTHLYFI